MVSRDPFQSQPCCDSVTSYQEISFPLFCFCFNRMTDEERNEMEKQVRSLQESYSLLSNEALKQLQEAQYLDDEKMEEKVTRWKLTFQAVLSVSAWLWNHT